jgi:hypothetical protein
MPLLASLFDSLFLGAVAYGPWRRDAQLAPQAVRLALLALVSAGAVAYAVRARWPISSWIRGVYCWRRLPRLSQRDASARARTIEAAFDELAAPLAPHMCADDRAAFRAYRRVLFELRNRAERPPAPVESER